MKTLALIPALLLFACAASAEDKPAGAPPKDYVAMKVGGEEIKKSEIDSVWKTIFPGGNAPAFDTFDEKVKENVYRGVASEHLLYQQAEKAGTDNKDEVKARIAQAKRQILIQEFLKDKTKDLVADDKLKSAYDAKVKEMGSKEEVHARHILVKTEAEAKEIKSKLKKGGKFEDLAKEKSEDKSNSGSGGDLGWFTADRMVPEFSKVAFALKKGEVSDPVKTQFGWHVIKLEDRRAATAPGFDQMKDNLRQEQGNKAVADYVQGLLKDTKLIVIDANGKEKTISSTMTPMGGDALTAPEKN